MRKHLRGNRAWATLFAEILAYEAAAPAGQLMSESCDVLITKRPVLGPIIIWGAGIYLTAHLANTFQALGIERYDLIAKIPRMWP